MGDFICNLRQALSIFVYGGTRVSLSIPKFEGANLERVKNGNNRIFFKFAFSCIKGAKPYSGGACVFISNYNNRFVNIPFSSDSTGNRREISYFRKMVPPGESRDSPMPEIPQRLRTGAALRVNNPKY